MRNPFKEFGANTDGPFTDAFPITPSDDNDLPEAAVMLWMRGYRQIRVTAVRGTDRTFVLGDHGTVLPIGVKKVWATGTEAWTQGGGEMHGLVIGGAV